MIFQNGVSNVLPNSENHQKLWENEDNLAIFTVILMAGFGTQNVYTAL